VLGGTSLGFSLTSVRRISTLSEEAENPRRNILLATGPRLPDHGDHGFGRGLRRAVGLAGLGPYPDVDTAYVHVAGRAGGSWLFSLINITLLVATVGSGMGTQLGAARLLYGMWSRERDSEVFLRGDRT